MSHDLRINEFRYNPNLAVGDTVEVLVDKREDFMGQLVLSHKKARVIKAWDRVNAAHESGEVVNGFVNGASRLFAGSARAARASRR